MLEHRISELEAENRQLRAQSPSTDAARENAELKERIKTLENGWQTVLTALAAQGLPLPAAPSAPSIPATVALTQPQSPLSLTLPLSPASTHESSPLESMDHDFDSPSPLAFTPSSLSDFDTLPLEPQTALFAQSASVVDATRHLARMATTPSGVSQQRVASAPPVPASVSLALSSVRITPVKSSSHPAIRRWRISSANSSIPLKRQFYLRVKIPVSQLPPQQPPPGN